MMDYGALPPEINSTRMYFGPGSAPMLAAAAAWDGLAAELSSTAALYQSVIGGLVSEGWLGPASASMVAAVTPYMTWMRLTGASAEQTATQATAGAAAYEAAFAMTVPPTVVAANRAQLATLIATNVLGQNTPAIAVNEGEYAEMWAQDAAAMYGYAANSAAAAKLTSFTQAPQTTNPAGQAGQATTVAQTTGTTATSGTQEVLGKLTSTAPSALQSLSTPLATSDSSVSDFLNSNFVNGVVSGGYINPAIISPAVISALSDINSLQAPGLAAPVVPPGSSFSIPAFASAITPEVPRMIPAGGLSAGMTKAALVGHLSVPQSWTAAAQVENHAGAAVAGGGWNSSALPESPAAVPGMPGVPAAAAPGRHFGNGPRYGFHVTVMPRPPAAG